VSSEKSAGGEGNKRRDESGDGNEGMSRSTVAEVSIIAVAADVVAVGHLVVTAAGRVRNGFALSTCARDNCGRFWCVLVKSHENGSFNLHTRDAVSPVPGCLT